MSNGPRDILMGTLEISGPTPLLPFTDLVSKAPDFTLFARVVSGVDADILFETSQDGIHVDNESEVPKHCGVGAQVSHTRGPNETRRYWAIFATPVDATPTVVAWGVTIQPRV